LKNKGASGLIGEALEAAAKLGIRFAQKARLQSILPRGEAELAKRPVPAALWQRVPIPPGDGWLGLRLEFQNFDLRQNNIRRAASSANIDFDRFASGDSRLGKKLGLHAWLGAIHEGSVDREFDQNLAASEDQLIGSGGLRKEHAGIRRDAR
jgi:hypothetical protein